MRAREAIRQIREARGGVTRVVREQTAEMREHKRREWTAAFSPEYAADAEVALISALTSPVVSPRDVRGGGKAPLMHAQQQQVRNAQDQPFSRPPSDEMRSSVVRGSAGSGDSDGKGSYALPSRRSSWDAGMSLSPTSTRDKILRIRERRAYGVSRVTDSTEQQIVHRNANVSRSNTADSQNSFLRPADALATWNDAGDGGTISPHEWNDADIAPAPAGPADEDGGGTFTASAKKLFRSEHAYPDRGTGLSPFRQWLGKRPWDDAPTPTMPTRKQEEPYDGGEKNKNNNQTVAAVLRKPSLLLARWVGAPIVAAGQAVGGAGRAVANVAGSIAKMGVHALAYPPRAIVRAVSTPRVQQAAVTLAVATYAVMQRDSIAAIAEMTRKSIAVANRRRRRRRRALQQLSEQGVPKYHAGAPVTIRADGYAPYETAPPGPPVLPARPVRTQRRVHPPAVLAESAMG